MKEILRWLAALTEEVIRTFDWPLLLALGALMGIGLMVQYSAGGDAHGMHNMLAQGVRFAIGLAVMWALSRVPPARLRGWTPGVFLASLLPLVLVLFIGTGKHGRHWIDLKVFYLQPSELLKITLPMALAWYLNREPLPPQLRTRAASAALVALPTALVLLQPDFGTAMLVAASGVFAIYLAGLSWKWIAPAAAGGAVAFALAMFAPIKWFSFLREYQQNRILTFRDPENDPLGAGWNIVQSKIAIGAGGFTGKGWGQGSQSHLDYLPEHTTDFIFSVLSEEFGWIGVFTVLALYLFVIGRCLWIAIDARDTYSRLLAGTLGLSFFVYVIVNGGMISGLLPVVGVPMPLLSYGGTSAVSLLAGLGLVMAVKAHRPVHGY
ncbi:rod shape-determining protein RodA [Pseudoxanthomonas sangjuensis]|uniref:rod shape-determining protein RodA n=1 Tax=Pseudoxanthomonas sangjuensis TaxID=1503750 RepID=UPI001390CA78|nr:rod shape-determining protein RodA [Pseudoxanthomonas sangjuensis]KAF1707139.1 rod shape-determining protein RodA [Pseudoxanthomonas sangjuensis]